MTMSTIIMPDDGLEDEVEAVENFCWLMNSTLARDALWSPDGADEAINLYHALYYEGSVSNGGHAGYIANCDNRAEMFGAALNGTRLVGAQAYESIIVALIACAQRNPDEITRLISELSVSRSRLPKLDHLDDLFFAARDQRAMRSFAYDWLCRSPKVRIIAKEEFHEVVIRAGPASGSNSNGRPAAL